VLPTNLGRVVLLLPYHIGLNRYFISYCMQTAASLISNLMGSSECDLELSEK